jgi:hypothetical protein
VKDVSCRYPKRRSGLCLYGGPLKAATPAVVTGVRGPVYLAPLTHRKDEMALRFVFRESGHPEWTRTRLAAGGGDTTQAARRQRLPMLSVCQPLALPERALNFADDESGYPELRKANSRSLVDRR